MQPLTTDLPDTDLPDMQSMTGMGMMSTSTTMATPLRTFLRTESGSTGILVAAIGLALVWANVAPSTYNALWQWVFPVRIGPLAANLDLRTWVNSGLMTLFFLVVGLEARREFDLGDLRDRQRLILPVAALLVIAIAYSGHLNPAALGVAVAAYVGVLLSRRLRHRARTPIFTALAFTVWAALLASGIDPVVAGLAVGLATAAYVPSRDALEAATAPITLGIFFAYVVGKPAAVFGTSWIIARTSRGTIRPQVGWAAVLGSGTIAGVGFTVSLLIASLAFTGAALDEAKLGVLAAAIGASLFSLAVYRATALLPAATRARALLGAARSLSDLTTSVDDNRVHVRGPVDAPVTVVEYGDFECPWTGMVAPTARELLAENSDIRYVWRHLPLHDVHPQAQLAAEAAEAAGAQGAFWPMHDLLLTRQSALYLDDLVAYAAGLGLDVPVFRNDLVRHRFAARVARDIESADRSGVAGTPTFFINEHRHDGPQDLSTLNRVISGARISVPAFS